MDNFAGKSDVDKLARTLSEYAPLFHVKELRNDIQDFVKRDDFNIVARELEYVKKDLGKLCSKEEMMTRLTVFNSEVNTKLMDRPTIVYFKKVLQAYDQKIE